MPVNSLSKKLVRVDVSSGSYICLCPSFSQYFQRHCFPLCNNGSWWKPSRGAILEDI